MNILNYKNIIAVAALLLAVTFAMLVLQRPESAFGSIRIGDEYQATSTAANNLYGATVTSSRVIKTGTGSIGSYVITGANTGVINFYDATTTDVNKRTGNPATSTILIASFPASAAAGTYTLDVEYKTALYIDLISGAMATGTVTYH